MFIRLTLVAAAALLATSAHATLLPSGTPDPSNVVLVESPSGEVSATYSGAAIDRVLLISGASASSRTLGAFVIQDNCDTTTLSVIFNNAAGSAYRAYLCNMKANNIINGTGNNANGAPASLLLIKRDTGGSTQGVQPIYLPTKIAFMNMTGCSANPGVSPTVTTANFLCTGTGNYFSDAGISDVEPAILASLVNGGSGSLQTLAGSNITVRPVFQQIFAPAVNLKAYRALQQSQGLPTDDLPANRPSLPSTWVTSALGNGLNGGNSRRGWGMVISPTVDAAVHTKQINICRRATGSGTQAASNAYFLNGACSAGNIPPAANVTPLAIVGASTSANATSYTSATLVEGCLATVDALVPTAPGGTENAYGLAVLGRDTDPIGTGQPYRFVKLDGLQPEGHPDPISGQCTGTKNFPGCDDAQQGRYNLVYETTMQWNSLTPGNAGKLAALNQIANVGFNAAALKLNTPAVVDGVMAPPTTYAGLYGSLPLGSDAQVYASRVSRLGNSCAPLRITK